jgi:hypothetical protein
MRRQAESGLSGAAQVSEGRGERDDEKSEAANGDRLREEKVQEERTCFFSSSSNALLIAVAGSVDTTGGGCDCCWRDYQREREREREREQTLNKERF